MKTFFVLAMIAISLLSFGQTKKLTRSFKMTENMRLNGYIRNTLIVKYKISPKPLNQNSFLTKSKVTSFLPKFPASKRGLINSDLNFKKGHSSTKLSEDLSTVYELKYSGNETIENIINELLIDSNVEYAEPSYICHTFFSPNDPIYGAGKQSYLKQIHAQEAWNIQHNSPVLIAIVDNGSEISHEDLAENVFLNRQDPQNGVDDDNDGYIDNYHGWDFVGADSNNIKEDNDPNTTSPSTNHGIHVSGLASAVSDNNIGITSIAINAKLLFVKVAGDNDPDNIIKGYEGIKYAVDQGANIINCSWGGNANSQYQQDIINYAIANGCLVVAAAGNSNSSEPVYPAAYHGVLSVTSVNKDDAKSPTGNYGDFIDISAPGTNILSTTYQNTYGTLSGTSMSCAIVSSAAALVKGYHPEFSMQQVGQQLRVSSDNIDFKNSNYKFQLGKGRLNIYSAMTKSSPSIRNEKVDITGKNTFSKGDTSNIYLNLHDYLEAANNLNINLTSSSNFVKVLNSNIKVGIIQTSQNVKVGPFKVLILSSTPDNSLAEFKINYNANNDSYNDFEKFTIAIATNYLNVTVNKVNTSFTGNGRIGYSSANAHDGLGFIYEGYNKLFEGSLLIGYSPNQISDNARNGSGGDNDFLTKVSVKNLSTSSSLFDGESEFDDTGNTSPINIYIKQRLLSYSSFPDDKYVIVTYRIFNQNNFQINGLYIGLFTDWDVSSDGQDITQYDPSRRLAYVYGHQSGTPYVGVKLLSISAPPLYYPLSLDLPNNPLSNGFSKKDKFQTLKSGIHGLNIGSQSKGYDVSFVSGNGPYNIAAKDSITVAFAILAGNNLQDIQQSEVAAANKYLTIESEKMYSTPVILEQNYPNPASNSCIIRFAIPNSGNTSLTLYNIMGQKIANLMNSKLPGGNYAVSVDVSKLQSGVYIYSLNFNSVKKVLKMVVSNKF